MFVFLSFRNFCLLVLLLVLFLPFYFLFSFYFYYYLDGLKAHAPFQLKSWPNSIQVQAHPGLLNLAKSLAQNEPSSGPILGLQFGFPVHASLTCRSWQSIAYKA